MGLLRKIARVFLIVAICASTCAASAKSASVQDFHHTAWSANEGLGAVFDIQQSAEGYLWLTTSTGVFRFDGVRFQTVQEATDGAAQDREIHSAYPSAYGGVWFKTRGAGLLLWKNGRLLAFPDRRCTPVRREGLAESQDGSLWLQGTSGLYHLTGGTCAEVGPEGGYPGGSPAAVLVDRKGTLWVRTPSGSLLFLPPGQSRLQVFPYAAGKATSSLQASSTDTSFLHQAPDGTIWLSGDRGLRRVTDKSGRPADPAWPNGQKNPEIRFGDFTFASDGTLWAATNRGVRRFDQVDLWKTSWATEDATGESFAVQQGLSSNAAWKVLVDREGSVWVGTNSGLDRFRRASLSTTSFPETQEHDFALLAGEQGSVWTGNETQPLTSVAKDGTGVPLTLVRGTTCLRRDREGVVWSAGGPDHQLWRISGTHAAPEPYPEATLGAVLSLAFDRNNDPWISTATGGAYHLSHGQWLNQNEALGKKAGVLGTMANDSSGNVWFGFSNKLVRWNGSDYQRFSFHEAHGVSETTLYVRGPHVWLAGTGGVELFSRGRFSIMRWSDPTLPDRVSGIVETDTGDLWMNGFSGITHVSASELARWLKEPNYAVTAERFDALDGLSGFSAERTPEPSVIESTDGRLWFATTKGIAVLDPKMLEANRNRLPPPVEISSVIANGTNYAVEQGLMLPKRTNSLQINYTALSLAVPERVKFRYKLEGVDTDWQEAGTRREAFYNSLSPGHYLFHVIACNNDGVWNEAGASLGFSITPIFYQTDWFKAVCVLAVVALMWWMVRRHIGNIARNLQAGLAERLAERERIARELHDTLLQSLFATTLHFQSAADHLAEDDPARKPLYDALEQADHVMREGRQRIRNLRASRSDAAGLVDALADYGHQLQTIDSPQFQISTEGEQRRLHPLFQEEVLLIGREAISNAFRHADAGTVVVTVTFLPATLQLLVRDDGRGIEEAILQNGGRRDHWGMPGMLERARKMHARLHITRPREGGTQINLQVAGAIIYQAERTTSSSEKNLLRWLSRDGDTSSLDKSCPPESGS